MVILGKFEEEALRIILDEYDKAGSKNYTVIISLDSVPSYISERIKNISDNLMRAGFLSESHVYISGDWDISLMAEALEYFEEQAAVIQASMPGALPRNAEQLLQEILDTEENMIEFLQRHLPEFSSSNREFEGIVKDIENNGYIEVIWADGGPVRITPTNAGRNYFERRKACLKQAQKEASAASVYNITNSNVIFGNSVNSQLSIDNSICEIEKQIEQHGGENTEELKELLTEVKDVIENMKTSGQVTKNTNLFKRLTQHLEKHGWFYAEIVGLLGSAALMKMGGQL